MKNTYRKNHQYFGDIINLLKDLNKLYPAMDICRHLSDATSDYTNIWGISNKELHHLLLKYKVELELNGMPSEEEVNQIIEDGKHIGDFLHLDEGDEILD